MLLALASALAQEAPPIVNGDTTTAYPEVVFLYFTNASGSYGGACTGSVVADEWILTAAHCVTDDTGQLTQLWAFVGSGVDDLQQQQQAEEWYPHPRYDGTGYYDIALVKLPRAFRGVPLMAVNKDTVRSRDLGQDYRLVGFGQTSDRDNSGDSTKRYADVPLYDYDDALAIFWDQVDDQNACHGDSGGPALELRSDGGYEVAGIIDFAYGNSGDCEGNGVATARVDFFLDWIEGYTPVYSYEELYGETDTDTDSDTDTDTDTDSDTDTDTDTDTDSETDTELDEEPVRPDDVGEDYDTVSLVGGCGCASGSGTPALLVLLAGLVGALARRR
jgi:MYXO-CTERM domain-containing protein